MKYQVITHCGIYWSGWSAVIGEYRGSGWRNAAHGGTSESKTPCAKSRWFLSTIAKLTRPEEVASSDLF